NDTATLPGPITPSPRRRGGRGVRSSLAAITRQSARLLARRHVREKRQSTPTAQAWLCLDGEALCVTPRLLQLAGGQSLDWLRLDNQPLPRGRSSARRWVSLNRQFNSDAGLALLVRQRHRPRLFA